MFNFSKALITLVKCRTAGIACKYSTEVPIRSLLNNSEKTSKATMICKCKRMIKFAARTNGPFLEYNPKLAYWVEEAKRCGVSKNGIDFSINITSDHRAMVGIHEISFQGKCLILAQYETVDVSQLIHKLITISNDFDASFFPSESHRHLYYNQEAVIVVDGKTGDNTLDNSDKEKMSSAGDLLISEETDHTGQKNLIVHCDISHLHQVKRNLINMDYTVQEAFVGFTPKVSAKFSSISVEKVADLVLLLSDLEEIDRLYENVE